MCVTASTAQQAQKRTASTGSKQQAASSKKQEELESRGGPVLKGALLPSVGAASALIMRPSTPLANWSSESVCDVWYCTLCEKRSRGTCLPLSPVFDSASAAVSGSSR